MTFRVKRHVTNSPCGHILHRRTVYVQLHDTRSSQSSVNMSLRLWKGSTSRSRDWAYGQDVLLCAHVVSQHQSALRPISRILEHYTARADKPNRYSSRRFSQVVPFRGKNQHGHRRHVYLAFDSICAVSTEKHLRDTYNHE